MIDPQKEARDKCGDVVAVAYYNKTADVSIEGLGQSSAQVGTSLALAGSFGLTGTVYIDEVTIDLANEDFVKSSIKATCYWNI